jgi:hypothetical protein
MRTLDDLTDAARRIDPTRFSLDDIPALEILLVHPSARRALAMTLLECGSTSKQS